jgi:hypothetical protein
MLVAARLSLGPLAKGEAIPTNDEARRIVGDACNLLSVALANIVEATKNLPGFPLGYLSAAVALDSRSERAPDPRMSSQPMNDPAEDARLAEQCALTRPIARLSSTPAQFKVRLTRDQLDRLRRCANGNTLRFESADIVDALVAAGYAKEGVGRVVTVTADGHRYLSSHPA